MIDNHSKYAWEIPLEDKSGKSTTNALKVLLKKQKENLINFGQIELKSFMITLSEKKQNIQLYSTNSV